MADTPFHWIAPEGPASPSTGSGLGRMGSGRSQQQGQDPLDVLPPSITSTSHPRPSQARRTAAQKVQNQALIPHLASPGPSATKPCPWCLRSQHHPTGGVMVLGTTLAILP